MDILTITGLFTVWCSILNVPAHGLDSEDGFIVIDAMLKDRSAAVGDTVKLKCRITGSPRPTFTWYKDNTTITAGRNRNIKTTKWGSRLIIRKVTPKDVGWYTCEAVNSFGKVDTSSRVDIKTESTPLIPTFRVPEAVTVQATEGDTVVLPCTVDNLGSHKVSWIGPRLDLLSVEQIIVTPNDRISVERPYQGDWNLHIRDSAESDQGNYTCIVNTEPAMLRQVQLLIDGHVETEEDKDDDIVIVQSFVEDIAILPCKNDLTNFKVVWVDPWSTLLTFEQRRIVDDRRISIQKPSVNEWNLHISGVKESDQGDYACQTNTNPITVKKIRLIVNDPCVHGEVLPPLCKEIGYTSIRLPNHLGHKTVSDIGLELHQFLPIVKVQCSPVMQEFLCYAYLPPCSTPRQPCRSMCVAAKTGCENLLNKFGFIWPDLLQCDQFPDENCLGQQETSTTYNVKESDMCFEVPEICEDYGYTQTRLPNSFGHMSTTDAWLMLESLNHLIDDLCGPDYNEFLCYMLLPPCSSLSKPCRSLCLVVENECGKIMHTVGLDWPEAFRCDQFPTENCLGQKAAQNTEILSGSDVCHENLPYICTGIGYNGFQLPNKFGALSKSEAVDDFFDFSFTLVSKCHPAIKEFLCYVSFPPCGLSNQPCKSLCLEIKQACNLVDHMRTLVPWPESFDCEQFPEEDCRLPLHQVTTQFPALSDACLHDEELPPFCKQIGYTSIKLPNHLGHRTVSEAGLELHQFFPIVKVKCSPVIQEFLCYVYLPPCSSPRQPCRSLCMAAKIGCETLLNKFGFQWPESLQCERFPTKDCIGQQETPTIEIVKESDMCVGVPDSCEGYGYSQTLLPNKFGHNSTADVSLMLDSLNPLKDLCGPDYNEFLCYMLAPPCSSPKKPCRSLCLAVEDRCGKVMQSFGLDWPEAFKCDPFPTDNCLGQKESQNTKFLNGTDTCLHDEELQLPALCKDIGYTSIKLPNHLGHRTVAEAGLELHQYFPVVKVQCSTFLREFLCYVYVPPCSSPRQPCRSLCLEAKRGCETLMNKLGFSWPEFLLCDQFPNENCLGQQETSTTEIVNESECLDLTDHCVEYGYSQTLLPNIVGHNSTTDALTLLSSFIPLKHWCGPDFFEFLCYILLPPCSTPRRPCKNLCLTVERECGKIMSKFGIGWPKECDQFPTINCLGQTEDPNSKIMSGTDDCDENLPHICTGIGYTGFQLPNKFGAHSRSEAVDDLYGFTFSLMSSCHTAIKEFLCYVSLPPCGLSNQPCKNFCLEIKRYCEKTVTLGTQVSWPESLDCDQFPEEDCLLPHHSHQVTTLSTEQQDGCLAYNGSYVENGDFAPGPDPCHTCRCVDGKVTVCMGVGCVPPTCPNATPIRDECCKYVCPEQDTAVQSAAGNLSVQQVGSRSAIIHWIVDVLPDQQSVSLLYNNSKNGTLINTTLTIDAEFILLHDLDSTSRYQFTLMLYGPSDPRQLDTLKFKLDGRVGQTLHLGDAVHGKVYESHEKEASTYYVATSNVYIAIDSFHRVETKVNAYPICGNRDGCGALQFYMYNCDGQYSLALSLMFDDYRDFNWAKAHL